MERHVNDHRRRASVPGLKDETDPELVLHMKKEFEKTWVAGQLSLNTGALRFEY